MKSVCEICKRKFKNLIGLGAHLKVHSLSSNEYYDKFFKTLGDGICKNPNCNNPTKCKGLNGYDKYCSEKCSTLDPSIQKRMKMSMMKNHGVEHALQSDVIFEKLKKENKKKYGVEFPQQRQEIREKTNRTNKKLYGGNAPLCSADVVTKFKVKIKELGKDWNNRNKAKGTCIKRYGKDNISKVPEIQKRKEETCLKNYGVRFISQTEDRRSYMKNGGAAHCNSFIKNPSKPQVILFNLIQEVAPYPVINYPCIFTNKSIDIAIPSLSIAIEYDGSYWHQNAEEDLKRQNNLERMGWKFIRYVDRIPSKRELINDINNMFEKESECLIVEKKDFT